MLQKPPAMLLFLLCLVPPFGCRHTGVPSAASAGDKTFLVRGRVVATDASAGTVTLDAAAIPGYMDAMTMPYQLAAPNTISELHPGDRITARLVIDHAHASDGVEPLLDQVVVISQARPDTQPKVQYHVPHAGDDVPDFGLLNQSARSIHLSQFKGKVLLLTFIYTRCPLADFCPRMSRNFAEIDHALAAEPTLYAATHLLSISFDPAYDTPKVLRSYGEAYTGRYTKEDFHHWDFAVPAQQDLAAVTQFFDVGVTPDDDPQGGGAKKNLTHSLATILIGKDGKLAAWYPNNDWKPAEVIAQIKAAAA